MPNCIHVSDVHTAYCKQMIRAQKLRGVRGGWALQADHLHTKNNQTLMTLNEKSTGRFHHQSGMSKAVQKWFCVSSRFFHKHTSSHVAVWSELSVLYTCRYKEPEQQCSWKKSGDGERTMTECVIPTHKIFQKSLWCYISHPTDGRVKQSRNGGCIASKPIERFSWWRSCYLWVFYDWFLFVWLLNTAVRLWVRNETVAVWFLKPKVDMYSIQPLYFFFLHFWRNSWLLLLI